MTRKNKVKSIYLNRPDLVNDDMGLLMYIYSRFFLKHGADQLTEAQEVALRDMGNPEHWTRVCRKLREEDEDIKKMVDPDVQEARHKEFVDYKYNAKPQYYIDEDGYETVRV